MISLEKMKINIGVKKEINSALNMMILPNFKMIPKLKNINVIHSQNSCQQINVFGNCIVNSDGNCAENGS